MRRKIDSRKMLAMVVVSSIILGTAACGNSQAAKEDKLDKQLNAGRKYVKEEQYEDALEAYEEALLLDPSCENAYIAMADIYIEMGKYKEAKHILNEAEDLLGESKRLERRMQEVLQALEDSPDEEEKNNNNAFDPWNGDNKVSEEEHETKKDKVIRVMSFTDEVPGMVRQYLEDHPELGYKAEVSIIPNDDNGYQYALNGALDSKDAPDIYTAEAAFVLRYCQGDMASKAGTYKDLGIDVDRALRNADIAQYAIEIGTRPSDGALVGLPYQATGGCFIYRRSVAKDIWGTDAPEIIQSKIGGGSGSWDQFWAAAEECKRAGNAIISSDGDIWHAIENSADKGWIVDGKLYIDPKRAAFLDIAKWLKECDYSNETQDWADGWFDDMAGTGERPVLGFFGPDWLINYTIREYCGDNPRTAIHEGTYGDWAVCQSPVGFSWGGTWVLSGKNVSKDSEKAQVVRDIISWITLDTDENSLQYKWANGLMNENRMKNTVASGNVMSKSDGTVDLLGGQNMFEYFVPANKQANGSNLTQYDEMINYKWREAVCAYVKGDLTREEAIQKFTDDIRSCVNIGVDPAENYIRFLNQHRISLPISNIVAAPTPIPDRDLGGIEIIIGDHYSPETPAAPTNAQEEATAQYRDQIMKKYNFRIQSKAVAGWGDMTDTCVASITAGDPVAQIFELDYRFIAKPLANGLFYDLATLKELDFTEDKWNVQVKEIMTKGNSIYGMSAKKSEPRGGVIWNKRLFEEAGLDPNLPYDLQKNGEWTWSKFKELCGKLTRDTNGDGVTDVYAVVGYGSEMMQCLVASTGKDFFGIDANDKVFNNCKDPDVLKAINFAVEIFNAGYDKPQPADSQWDWFIPAFQAGEGAMTFNQEYTCQPNNSYGNYQMYDDVGFVMPPKPDGQADYYSYVCDNICIIPSCYDAETAGKIAFGYNVYTMNTPGYDDPEDWKNSYYAHFNDERAVDETIVRFNDGKSAKFLVSALIADLEIGDLVWQYPFIDSSPNEAVNELWDSWQEIIDNSNW